MKTDYGVLTKSNRALMAKADGMVTYSKLSAWQKRAIDAGAVVSTEWHHTSAAANRTYYYSPEQFENLNPADFPAKKRTVWHLPGAVNGVKSRSLKNKN